MKQVMKMTYLNTLFFIIEEDAGIDMKEAAIYIFCSFLQRMKKMTIISTVIELRKFVNIFYIIFDIKI